MDTTKPSRKHHYLPRYYLKGFADEKNSFFVYDKTNDNIFKSSPNSIFFENNLNTVSIKNGQTSDFLEKFYAGLENKTWHSLDCVRSSSRSTVIGHSDKLNLFLFLSFLHWRLPSNSVYIDELSKYAFDKDKGVLDYFSLRNKDGSDANLEIIETIKKDPAFKKSAKVLAPFAPFYKDKKFGEKLNNWRFVYTNDNNNWYFVGDNPIITTCKNDHDPINCLSEFIFPISGKILLINVGKKIKNELPREFIFQYSVSILHRANRFIAHSNKDFLQAIVDEYRVHKNFNKTDEILNHLFDML